MQVHVGVSLFPSPTTALGNVSGQIEVLKLPRAQEAFPWPDPWVLAHPSWFSPEQSRIVGVTEVNGLPLVVLDGIVFPSEQEARECALFLESAGGLFFDEYEREERRHDV
jgi:hypothetical protein